MKRFILFAVASLMLSSCNYSQSSKVPYEGEPYELVMIADANTQKSMSWETLIYTMNNDVPMLNQKEPMFNVITTIPTNVKGIMRRHRNLVFLNIGEQYDSISVKIEMDKYAEGQLALNISGPNDTTLANYLWNHQDLVLAALSKEERKRMVDRMTEYGTPSIVKKIQSKFDFTMQVPRGYKIRESKENFLWFSNETKLTSQGVVIYTYPYDPSSEKFTLLYATEKRDSVVSIIPGPSKGSYMRTSRAFSPIAHQITVNGRKWIAIRGFWDVENDFMGGPFVSFSTIDEKNNRIIVIDEYVYSPSNTKKVRNLVRQLESMVYSTVVPGTETPEQELEESDIVE
ncbi:MAG: DUF4837 family protein [Rikenellaceae bacterium]